MEKFVNQKLNEFNDFIKFRKVAVIGLGVSNIPLIDYLYEKKAKVTVFDEKSVNEIPKDIMTKINTYEFDYYLGKDSLKNLKNFVLIFRSPSCLPTRPELVEEEKRGAIITSEIEMLIKMCPCPIIGVTGSEGKTTTTTLIYNILKQSGYNTYLGGNIGTPLFTKLNKMKPKDIVVLELSSFQLMGMEVSPQTSVITNITPNHLDINKNYEEYIDSKKNIYRYQNENGTLILNYDNEITKLLGKEANGKVIYFSSKEKLDNGYIVNENAIKECEDGLRKHIVYTDELNLKGMHNFENICTALAATKDFVNSDLAIDVIKNFKSVEHRLEFIKKIDGVKWYNDSASSSPTRTIAGINAFESGKIILIAGGYDKNLDYKPLAKPIVDNVKGLILLGQTSDKIEKAVQQELIKQNKNLNIYKCKTLKDTVKKAKELAKKGDIVLFSPASASFDMFKNAYERGKIFKNFVNQL